MSIQRQFALEVVTTLRDSGFLAYWAGGCVRDELLGREPKDYDVATSAQPDEIRTVFGKRRTLSIGAAFGVITVLGSKEQGQIEVATFRQDAGYSDGRHPDSVTFSTPEHDAQRRDFTINGLFFDPLDERVIDFVGGRNDLQAKVIRAIGNPDARIDEDKLRMLRAVRFAATYEFDIDPDTLAALQRHSAELRLVSAERITEEMRRMLRHRERARAVQLLAESGLLSHVLPQADLLSDEPVAWRKMLEILSELGENGTFAAALATLLRSAAGQNSIDDAVVSVAGRWRLSNDEQSRTAFLLRHEALIRGAQQATWPELQRVLVLDGVEELLNYSAAVALVADGSTDSVDYCRAKLVLPPGQLNPVPLLTGDDLKRAGIPPGKIYQPLLSAVRDAQLEGTVDSADQALQMAIVLWKAQE